MKALRFFGLLVMSAMISSLANAASGNIGFYTDHAAYDVQLLQSTVAATKGGLIFNVNAGPGGRGSDGLSYRNSVSGQYIANQESGSFMIFTDNCAAAVSVLQGVTYSSQGRLVLNANCTGGGYGSNGEYYSNAVIVNYYVQ